MTTIILVAIGILIAAAAALMVVFYGGDAFWSSDVKAEAARLVGEGAQISYAIDLFEKQEEYLPGRGTGPGATTDALTDLKDKKYLPIPPGGAKITSGASAWKIEYGQDGMIYSKLGSVDDAQSNAVCKEARRQLQLLPKDAIYKCDGSDYPNAAWAAAHSLPDREPCCIRN